MAVELTLLETIDRLGEIGDVVRVSDGYARNFLLPRKLAVKATPGILRQLEAKKKQRQAELERQVQSCRELAEQIAKSSITIPMQAGDDEKLYGSVTAQQIVDGLSEMKIQVERKQVILREPIRKIGLYSVDLHVHRDVIAPLKVWVVKA